MKMLVLVLGAVGGVLGYGLARASARLKAVEAAPTLEKGHAYNVQLLIDPTTSDWGGVTDVTQAANNITALMQSPSGYGGWLLSSNPLPASPADGGKLAAGEASLWTFRGTWTRAEPFVQQRPDWLQDASASPI